MILIILMNCCFAAALPLLKHALQYIDPFLLVAYRMTIAGALLCAFQAMTDYRVFLQRLNWRLLTLNGLISMCLLCIFEIWSLQGITATKANIMWATLPLITALAMRLWHKTSLSYQQGGAIALGLTGIALLMTPNEAINAASELFTTPWHYDIAMLLAVIMAAVGYLCTEQLVTENHPVIITNGISMLIGGMITLIGTRATQGMRVMEITHWMPAIFYLTTIIVMVNFIGLSLQIWLTKQHSVTLLALSSFITPLCGALFGFLQGDTLTHSLLGATLCIGTGLYIFYQHDMKRTRYAIS